MKERAFFRMMVTGVMATVVAVLLPAQALAVCFQDQWGDIFKVRPAVQVGIFFSLVGEFVGATGGLTLPGGTSFPLVGSAHLRPDGKRHFGATVYAVDAFNVPFWVQGTLDPPSFDSGSGVESDLSFGLNALTFSPAACPDELPQ